MADGGVPQKPPPPPPFPMCGGRGLVVPEVLLMKLVDVGAQICYHKGAEERGEGLCSVTAIVLFNALLHN